MKHFFNLTVLSLFANFAVHAMKIESKLQMQSSAAGTRSSGGTENAPLTMPSPPTGDSIQLTETEQKISTNFVKGYELENLHIIEFGLEMSRYRVAIGHVLAYITAKQKLQILATLAALQSMYARINQQKDDATKFKTSLVANVEEVKKRADQVIEKLNAARSRSATALVASTTEESRPIA